MTFALWRRPQADELDETSNGIALSTVAGSRYSPQAKWKLTTPVRGGSADAHG